MITQQIDNVYFTLKTPKDFEFLSKYGKVFCVFDKNDSGNICFGVGDGKQRFFVKVAGAETINACISPKESVKLLQSVVTLYRALEHPNLIEIVESYPIKDLYITVFNWANGECLFDHWNFEKYIENPQLKPFNKFKGLPLKKRIKTFETIQSFFKLIVEKGYTAIDFYDGSIMYDFETDTTTICDIDLFRRSPTYNNMGKNMWGTKRLKSPEEYVLGEPIDQITNVFTLGALAFHLFGDYTGEIIRKMYESNSFIPCSIEKWEAGNELYQTALKAVSPERENRYQCIDEFVKAWNDKKTSYNQL